MWIDSTLSMVYKGHSMRDSYGGAWAKMNYFFIIYYRKISALAKNYELKTDLKKCIWELMPPLPNYPGTYWAAAVFAAGNPSPKTVEGAAEAVLRIVVCLVALVSAVGFRLEVVGADRALPRYREPGGEQGVTTCNREIQGQGFSGPAILMFHTA